MNYVDGLNFIVANIDIESLHILVQVQSVGAEESTLRRGKVPWV